LRGFKKCSTASLCNLCALCASVVKIVFTQTYHRDTENTEVALRIAIRYASINI
jgi:hypothetical protein